MCSKVDSWLFVIPPALFEEDSLSVGELSDFLAIRCTCDSASRRRTTSIINLCGRAGSFSKRIKKATDGRTISRKAASRSLVGFLALSTIRLRVASEVGMVIMTPGLVLGLRSAETGTGGGVSWDARGGAVYTVTTASEFRLRGLGPGVTNRKRKACFSLMEQRSAHPDSARLFKKGRLWAGLSAGFVRRGIRVLQWPPRQRFWATTRPRAGRLSQRHPFSGQSCFRKLLSPSRVSEGDHSVRRMMRCNLSLAENRVPVPIDLPGAAGDRSRREYLIFPLPLGHTRLKPRRLSSTPRTVPASLGREPCGRIFLRDFQQRNPLPAGSRFLFNL